MKALAPWPMLRLLAALLLGAVCAQAWGLGGNSLFFWVAISLLWIGAWKFWPVDSPYRSPVLGLGMAVWAFGLGAWGESRRAQPILIPTKGSVWVQLESAPLHETAQTWQAHAQLKAWKTGKVWQKPPSEVRLHLIFPKREVGQAPQPGQEALLAADVIQPVPPPVYSGGYDPRPWMARQGIFYQAWVKPSAWQVLEGLGETYQPNFWQGSALWIEQTLAPHLSAESLGLVLAFLVGKRQHLEPNLKQAYSQVGASHLLAVSGLQVVFLFTALGWMLRPWRRNESRERIFTLLVLLSIWFYVGLTGASASVVRAGIMFSLLLWARRLGRPYASLNVLGAAAFFQLVWDPANRADLGFWLSYSAVAGILLVMPWWESLWKPQNRFIAYFWEISGVALAAQVATFPITAYVFHQFPVWFWVANVGVIPLSMGVMVGGLLLLATAWVHPLWAQVLGEGLDRLVSSLNAWVETIATWPGDWGHYLYVDEVELALLYLLILGLGAVVVYRQARWMPACVALAVIWSGYNIGQWAQASQVRQVVLIGQGRGQAPEVLVQAGTEIWGDSAGLTQVQESMPGFWATQQIRQGHFLPKHEALVGWQMPGESREHPWVPARGYLPKNQVRLIPLSGD